MKGKSFEDHLTNVRLVLTPIQECGFTLYALKCKLFQTPLKYVGHIIDNDNISLDPTRINAILRTYIEK